MSGKEDIEISLEKLCSELNTLKVIGNRSEDDDFIIGFSAEFEAELKSGPSIIAENEANAGSKMLIDLNAITNFST